MLINRKYEILYFLGPTTRYVDVPTGEPTQDLLMMAREGLRTKLRGAIHRAIAEGQPVQLTDIHVRRNGAHVPITVTIKPVTGKAEEGLLLILFQDAPASTPQRPMPEQAEDGTLVQQLENELRATKKDLQSSVEQEIP